MPEVLFLLYLGVSFAVVFIQYIITYLSPYIAYPAKNDQAGFKTEKSPFISIHLPICNEPPDVVISTIRSLLQINYTDFEIVVLDNNTSREQIWKPVERFCRDKDRITFVHVPRLKGNKAGALNLCTTYMDKRAEYILVVDADYVVSPEILNTCIRISREQEVDLLQLPQSYRNTCPTSVLSLEYRSYFRIFMNMANWFNCVLSTGTLAFIKYEALKDIGGWNGDTLTEDADLGVRMLTAGHSTLYVDQELGHGLTPFDYPSLDKQRKRWVTGNIQVLKKHMWALIRNSVLQVKQKLGIFLQLTAWVDFKVIALLLFSLMHLSGINQHIIITFWFYFVTMTLLKVFTYRNTFDGLSLVKSMEMLIINQSLIISTGLSWLKAFIPIDLKFEVTRKTRTAGPPTTSIQSNISGLLLYTLMILTSLSRNVLSPLIIAVIVILHLWSRNHTKKHFEELSQ